MNGAGNVPFLSFDPDEDSQTLAPRPFDGPDGTSLFEELIKSKLGEENDRTWKGENVLHVSSVCLKLEQDPRNWEQERLEPA
jgi:hypothetical protein